jgi:hypothetical protein
MCELTSTKQINALKLIAIEKGGYHVMEAVLRMACKLHFNNYGKDLAPKCFKNKLVKSRECSLVLQLMDKDFSYNKALGKVLNMDKSINKAKLENELNIYI